MSRSRPLTPLTVAELMHYGPLSRAQAYATDHVDHQVSEVSLVLELDQIRRCRPNVVLVLHPSAVQGAWALESALRLAWERNASCVVAPNETAARPGIAAGTPGAYPARPGTVVTASTRQLADRFAMPLFTVDDPAQRALELAVEIADAETARARLSARCAVLFGELSSARDIVGVINSQVPGVSVALVTREGHVLAGRSAAAASSAVSGNDPSRVRVAVPGPDGRPWARLIGQLASHSPFWAETVESILRMARAPLAASVARQRLALAHQAAKDRLLLETLLRGGGPAARQEQREGRGRQGTEGGAEAEDAHRVLPSAAENEQSAREAGWLLEGEHVAVHLRSAELSPCDLDAVTPAVVAAWRESFFPHLPIVPLARGWATWWTGDAGEPEKIALQLRQRLAAVSLPIPLTAGVSQPHRGLPGLRRSMAEAELAAAVASGAGGGSVELFAELGPRAVLASLPVPTIAAAAEILLSDLREAAHSDVLITTLAALLDCAGSTSRAAVRLGVHRNTVLGRAERIRALGVDFDDPEQRLALHVACYALLSSKHLEPEAGRTATP